MKVLRLVLFFVLISPCFMLAMESEDSRLHGIFSDDDPTKSVSTLSPEEPSLPGSTGFCNDDAVVGPLVPMCSSGSDEENPPRLVKCLMCGKECAVVVGLPHKCHGKIGVFAFCPACLTCELEKNPDLWKVFECPGCKQMLQKNCIKHLPAISDVISLSDGSRLPLIDMSMVLECSIPTWLVKEKKRNDLEREIEVMEQYYQCAKKRIDRYNRAQACCTSTAIVLFLGFIGVLTAVIVYGVKGKDCLNSCCHQYHRGCDSNERYFGCVDLCPEAKISVILASVALGLMGVDALSLCFMRYFAFHNDSGLATEAKKQLDRLSERLEKINNDEDGATDRSDQSDSNII